MPTDMTVVAADNDDETTEREISIVLVRADKEHTLQRMFDCDESETFDPSVAVEVETLDGELLEVLVGDRIEMTVEVST